MRLSRLLAVAVAALALPGVASAGLATLHVAELPQPGERGLAAAARAAPFDLLGLHWQGSGTLRYRVHRAGGWDAWRTVAAETADAPDRGSAETRRHRGWRVTAGIWVGRADRVEVRRVGRIGRVRVFTVRS